METTPKRGLRFLHARRITGSPKAGTAQPVEMTVTRVTATAVYYRHSDAPGSVSTYIDRDRFDTVVKEVVSC